MDVPAVAYVRMSTDHQKYSTENQLDVIRSYATARGLQILRVFEDSGRSGLRLDGREALQNLMAEVQSGRADFKAILVYDVSRWGRFQDADEGAYHEHACSRAGIRVHYCGEQKSLQTDRVILVPGPDEEQRVVQRMYEMFVTGGRPEREIAEILNAEGHRTDLGRLWARATVHQVLTNEKYIGNNVFAKVSFKLKQRRVVNPRDMWIRAEGAYPSIVDRALFVRAREIVDARSRHFTDEELLAALRSILERQGMLSALIIDEQEGLPSSSAYRSRFGSLLRAYRLVGYQPDRDYRYIEINRALRDTYPKTVAEIISGIVRHGGTTVRNKDTDLVLVNDEFTISIVLARCQITAAGALRWHIRFDVGLVPDITIAVRMDEANGAPRDYYLLPSIDMTVGRLKLAEQNGLSLDAYRFETLDFFYSLASRARISEVA
ncbi:recombinase family protein [Rhodobacter capsulatus]|uniref:recombinase family protein n=1 Tax=Rhodobacter capsulatus TaxID=1061 RepID=UPI004026F829